MENINGYHPTKPFSTVGAGTASWTIAIKDGQEYFLKRFNSPKYVPSCLEFCNEYEAKKNALYNAIRELNNGNLVVVEDFFHWDTYYYIATQRVHETSITAEQVCKLAKDKLMVLMKTLAHCMMQLERGGIVHADLKPSNVMLKPTVGGFYSLKLIDFDSSFFVSSPPAEKDDLEGDMTYLSPEVLMCMCGEDIELTSKVDVFATGIMFHQFLSNKLPDFDSEYDSVCETVANEGEVRIAESIPTSFKSLIGSMLSRDPANRPTFEEVFNNLCAIDSAGMPESESSARRLEIHHEKIAGKNATVKNPWMKKAGAL
jgi:serine/threonine protein kinase